jgi:HAD superfamily phosphatase (TIGR01668 family)
MSLFPIPNFSFREITEISLSFLDELGIKFLMLDLDNTIAAYTEDKPAEDVLRWHSNVIQSGIRPFMITNSTRVKRVETFAEALEMGYIMRAKKPSPRYLLKAMEEAGFQKENSALVGDQIFTDTLAAKRAGITSIILRPRNMKSPWLSLRYGVEIPFRAACRNFK